MLGSYARVMKEWRAMPYAHCPACGKPQYGCLCQVSCSECGVVTNHTTAAHIDAMTTHCVECGDRFVDADPETRVCGACRHNAMEIDRE